MFSGLIREIAKVESFSNSILKIKAEYSPKIGDSIAVNGACLTVTTVSNGGFSVELSPESRDILALENYTDEVHIEPAMQMGDRFEGHVVQGHVDTIGVIHGVEKLGNSYNLFIKIDNAYLRFMVPKGSITVDGVSLTINSLENDLVRLTLIPHTMENTIFKRYKKGTRVNIESDLFARYIDHILTHREKMVSGLNWNQIDSIVARY
jgi:riboflavin synthase